MHISHFTCQFYHFFVCLASCGGSINGMCDYCRLDFRIFLSFLASYFFDLACSRRYLYDPSNYHSSFLLILITHLPFLWEMRCTHHDSTKSRNYDNIRRDIKSGFNSHSFLHRYTLVRYRASVHTNHLFFTL